MERIQLEIPEDIEEKYNHSLIQLNEGDNSFVGNEDKIEKLNMAMKKPTLRNAMILGGQGIGKSALVEHWLYTRRNSTVPAVVVTLVVEKLGELSDENQIVGRMRSLLNDMNRIRDATAEKNGTENFFMALFIDEVHKLRNYKPTKDSSGAMNALKEGAARGQFPIIIATTDYEYRNYIVKDKAFDRRFSKVIMSEPDLDTVKSILQRRLTVWRKKGIEIPEIPNSFLDELIDLTDGYIKNQLNPDKSLSMLESAVAYMTNYHDNHGYYPKIDHEILRFIFSSEGYEIDSLVTAYEVEDAIKRGIKGQPLASKFISDAINKAKYTPRDRQKPLLRILSVGTTGTGKTETARILAKVFFGRYDAMLVINGGDYATKESAIEAQNFIGDGMALDKQVVILIDEIEKSHPDVLNAYMRMIDTGIVIDSSGIERSINSTILIATSNLSAKTFSDLAQTMKLRDSENPDELTDDLLTEWYRNQSTVRKNLQHGDENRNNGIRPEFLERFDMMVPYLPLPNKINAQIARMQLEKFRESMKKIGIWIQLPKPMSKEQWDDIYPTTAKYENIDALSVMIAEDVISDEAQSEGARSITRFIEGSVKTAVAHEIRYREENHLSMDGAFRISTNGNASFENLDRERPDVEVKFVDRRDM